MTRSIIKDSLLLLLRKKNYMDITISDICRKAGVSRTTFYQHYRNIPEIVDELFEDALSHIGNMALEIDCPPEGNKECGQALCRFLRGNRRYQPLFFSDELYGQAIRRTVDHLSDDFLERMRNRTALDDDILRNLLQFQITGCLSVCRKNIQEDDDAWDGIQCQVDRFLRSGFQNM